ncbi:phosphotransferase [Citricoccus sp. SGAir0253]|uniref:phosphotransferase n=1 Tax=Citricoccus sp. SGAir0253 TaxID=2567881 RepID=UPI00352BAC63
MELAALASAAVPDLSPTGVVGSPDDPRDFSAAVVLDRQGNRWRVRSPRHEEAAMRLETELQVLSGFTPAVRAALPFRVPSVAGAVRVGGLRTFVYHDIPGREKDLEDLTDLGPRAVDDIGRVIAAVHALPAEVVENADLPVYTADQFRQRRLNELDQAATTGRIPSLLLRRWEDALEEMALWRFTPVVVHGDLHEDNLLVDHGRVVSVTGWTDLHIGDPADDFSWLASCGDREFTDAVVDAYWRHRTGGVVADEHLLRRAALAAEFALAQWLVRGIAAEDEDMAAEAETMLLELKDDVEAHGGQEISLTPPGPRLVPAPAPEAPAAPPASRPATAPTRPPRPEREPGRAGGSLGGAADAAGATGTVVGSGSHAVVPGDAADEGVGEELDDDAWPADESDDDAVITDREPGTSASARLPAAVRAVDDTTGDEVPEDVDPGDVDADDVDPGEAAAREAADEDTADGEATATVAERPAVREHTGSTAAGLRGGPATTDGTAGDGTAGGGEPSGDEQPAGSGTSGEPVPTVTGEPTTVIELDEVRQLHVERHADPSA